jgi:transcription elongation factor Elf1
MQIGNINVFLHFWDRVFIQVWNNIMCSDLHDNDTKILLSKVYKKFWNCQFANQVGLFTGYIIAHQYWLTANCKDTLIVHYTSQLDLVQPIEIYSKDWRKPATNQGISACLMTATPA